MEKIKLVIWDLDETFWTGTLSESSHKNEVKLPHSELLFSLTKHGIINSISSKNDYDHAKKQLEKFGVWDMFVFPSINWNPKGEAVKQIIADCQLRCQNVVFIDDNQSNLNEVEFYNPGIRTLSSPKELESIICWDDYKVDEELSRLKQYKLLEQKKIYRSSCSSNKEFLIKSRIRIQFIYDILPLKGRLAEMISRTNQLNYTKVRIGEQDIVQLCSNPDIQCAAIRVVDDFGDYGICGFYALSKSQKRLIHYLFSCRILNLGIESYVYQKLDRPKLVVVPPVAAALSDEKITWITETDNTVMSQKDSGQGEKVRITLLGGCDLDQLCHYLSDDKFIIYKDFNYSNERLSIVHREHTVFLRKTETANKEELALITKLPFLDEHILDFNFLSKEYDYLIYSPLMNYTQELYKHRSLNFNIAYGGYKNILETGKPSAFDDVAYADFKHDYVWDGQQSPSDFINDLEWLLSKIKSRIIFLNGAEFEIHNPNEIGAAKRHKEMNMALSQFVARHKDRCEIIDVNKYIKTREDLADNIRHYSRVVYTNLAQEVCVRTKVISRVDIVYMRLRIYKTKLKKYIRNIINQFH